MYTPVSFRPLSCLFICLFLSLPVSLPPPRRLFQVPSTHLHFYPVCTDLFGAGIVSKLLMEKSRTQKIHTETYTDR